MFSKIFEIIIEKKAEVENQKRTDKDLKHFSKECPDTVIQFLMLERKFYRKLNQRVQPENGILDIFKHINQNVDYIKDEGQQYRLFVSGCSSLKIHNQEFKNRIKSIDQLQDDNKELHQH